MTGELTAWQWLLMIPRLNYTTTNPRRLDQQIQIHTVPGELDRLGGAPLVKVSIAHPELPEGTRVHGSGNSLWNAVEEVNMNLWRMGVTTMPFLVAMQANVNRQEPPR